MNQEQSFEMKLLNSLGITEESIKLARRIYELKENDPNVDLIKFSRYSLPRYPGGPFLVANVELKDPFQSIEDFSSYLSNRELLNEKSKIVVEARNPLSIRLEERGLTKDAFCARFYQPYRIMAEKLNPIN